MKPDTIIGRVKSDEATIRKMFLGKVSGWKEVLKKSRKILSGSVAMIFLVQLTLANTVWAKLPPPAAAELVNPQAQTVAVDSALTTTSSSATSTQPQPESTDAFLLAGPLSPATSESALTASPETQETAAAQAPGRSLYVSTTGADTSNGAQSSPWKSISYAVSQLQAGDTLYIEAGTYQQSGGGAIFTTSGTSDAPITIQGLGNVIIEGTATMTIGGYTVASNYNPAFDTKGQDYIRFKNLTVNNLRAAVTVSPNSSYVEIDGLKADRNHFAVLINGGDHITVRNAVVTNSRNGFRTEATTGVNPTDILYENIDVSGSKDVYSGFETRYRNGDGFILEFGNRMTLRNVKSYDNWDGGFDVKATNVLMENVETYGNKNNFKVWGTGLVVKNSLSHNAKYFVGDPVAGEGYGVNNRMGQATFINTTFANNEVADIRADNDGGASSTILQNSIIVRDRASGSLYVRDGGLMTDNNNIWYDARKAADFTISGSSRFINPELVNLSGRDFHLQSGSPAIDAGSMSYPIAEVDQDNAPRVSGSSVDLGAYEFSGTTPTDTTAPVISAVASASVTSNGATINWTTNETSDSQVEYRVQGTTAWSATSVNTSLVTTHLVVLSNLVPSTIYEYRVKSKDRAGNLATQAAISSLTTTNITPPSGDFVGVTGGATVSGLVNIGPNLTTHPGIRKVAYYLNGTQSGKVYASPYLWGGLAGNGTVGFDTRTLTDGNYTLGMVYTDGTGDHSVTISFEVNNTPTVDTTVPVISAVASAGVTSSEATINWTTNEVGDSQVQYRIKGTTAWLAATPDPSLVTSHSVKLTGLNAGTVYEYQVKSKDQAGNLATQATISSLTTLTPPIAETCTTTMCGVTAGQVVSGVVKIQPNLTLNPDIRKVAYYLNGAQSGKVYTAPFTWGGVNGFDTTQLADGTYTLSGAYTISTGDKSFSMTFVVRNGVTPPPPSTTTCVSGICGVTAGQVVGGTVMIRPDLDRYPDIRKVAYYLNGVKSGRVYQSPFLWGGLSGNGTTGFDTRMLSNGSYTLAMVYTDGTGDHEIQISFKVSN